MRKYVIAVFLIIVVVAVVIISVLQANTGADVVTEDFEGDIGDWAVKGYVPQDPNNPGQTVEWHIIRVSNVSRSGTHSMEFFIDGRQDDGTIWLERKISARENAQIRVNVSFWLHSEQESVNTIAAVVAYAGNSKPQVEDDFAVVGAANEQAGWKNYAYTTDLTTDSNGEIWVSVGISVRWETFMTYYVDDVQIEIT
jgi:hypothetical protein